MKINKVGRFFISIHLWRSEYLVLAFHPKDWRFMIWFKPLGRPWYRRTWIGPFEIEFSTLGSNGYFQKPQCDIITYEKL